MHLFHHRQSAKQIPWVRMVESEYKIIGRSRKGLPKRFTHQSFGIAGRFILLVLLLCGLLVPSVGAQVPPDQPAPPQVPSAPAEPGPVEPEAQVFSGIELQRMRFAAPAGGAVPPAKILTSDIPVGMNEEQVQVLAAARLRVESPAGQTRGVLHFSERPNRPGELQVTVIIISWPGFIDNQLLKDSRVVKGGVFVDAPGYWLTGGLETELSAQAGRVTRIRVQDDGGSELRLSLRGEMILLEVIPPEEGGNPSGRPSPPYLSEELRFLDYDFLVAGSPSNGLLEAVFWRDIVMKINLVGNAAVTVARVVLSQQVARGNRVSLWLEGGGGLYTVSPEPTGDEDHSTPVWSFGGTGHYRNGDWGGALDAGLLKSQLLYSLVGGWQITDWLALGLEYQSFYGSSGYGLVIAFDF